MSAFDLENGCWMMWVSEIDSEGNESSKKMPCLITDVPVADLLVAWEDLVMELSDKEVELYKLKEAYLIAESEIVNNTDFKAIYGANNQKVRDNHVKKELKDIVDTKNSLELGIDNLKRRNDFIKSIMAMHRVLIEAGVLDE